MKSFAWQILTSLCTAVLVSCSSYSPPILSQAGCLPGRGQPSCFYKQDPKSKNTKLLVFVHGIFGSSATAWGDPQTGAFWPKMASEDNRFKDVDIYLVNYYAPHFHGAPSIHETAVNELGRLKSRNVFGHYNEIYFVTHSMGGLVTKSMLVQLNRGDDEQLLRRVKGVVFLGTPAQGAGLAKLGSWLSMNIQLQDLEPMHFNTYLQGLEDQWVQLMEDRDKAKGFFPRAYCAYETLATGISIVVPRETAASRCDGPLHSMPLNHSGLATPTGIEDDPYLWVMATIANTSTASVGREKADVRKVEANDDVIHIECHWGLMPKVLPPDGRIYALVFHQGAIDFDGGGLTEYFGPPGGKQSWGSEDGLSTGLKCQVTNYGKAVMFNTQITVNLLYTEVVRDKENPKSLRSGTARHSRKWILPIAKLDVGHNNPFVFYVWNQSKWFVQTIFPKFAIAQKAGVTTRSVVQLILSDFESMLPPSIEQ